MSPSSSNSSSSDDDASSASHSSSSNSDDDDDDDEAPEEASSRPQSLWFLPTHYRTTRKGKILQSTSERYLRDDLGLGFVCSSSSDDTLGVSAADSKGGGGRGGGGGKVRDDEGPARKIDDASELIDWLIAPTLSSSPQSSTASGQPKKKQSKTRLVILDSTVLLSNLDVLEHPDGWTSIPNIIVPQSSLAECRNGNWTSYGRSVELIRSGGGESEGGPEFGTASSGKQKEEGRRRRRCVIFFPDGHHSSLGPPPASISSTFFSPSEDDGDAHKKQRARIRSVAQLYGDALRESHVEVVLLTDHAAETANKQSKHKKRDCYTERTVADHVKILEREDASLSLSDLVAQSSAGPATSSAVAADGAATSSSSAPGGDAAPQLQQQKHHYPPHLSPSALSLGIKSGRYYQGYFRSERAGWSSGGYVTVRRGDGRVAVNIVGYDDANRAVDGDVVAVELNPIKDWLGGGGVGGRGGGKRGEDGDKASKGKSVGNKGAGGDVDGEEEGAGGAGIIASETAEPSLRDVDNVQDSVPVPRSSVAASASKGDEREDDAAAPDSDEEKGDNKKEEEEEKQEAVSFRRPTGKVVGIVRRNFRKNYCGSIHSAAASTSGAIQKGGGLKDDEEIASSDDDDDAADGKAETGTAGGDGNGTTDSQLQQAGTSGDNEKEGGTSALQQKQQQGRRQWTERDAIAARHEHEHPDNVTATVVFFAVDNRVPPVLLRTSNRSRLLGRRILVAIDSWPSDSEYPLGHYVRTLGDVGKKDVETEVLLHEHDIPCDPFPAKVLACLPPSDYKINAETSPGRMDLRHLPILSIDPPGCKDIDDALHCTVLRNGNYQVGVHIADVTHYVHAGTAIDLEAANRSTSTYLVNKRLDMLPGLLTTDLCSLKGNVDRFAFSVLWEVTPEAEIIDVDFQKTIIHSIAALTYQQAQGMIDQPDDEKDIQASAVKRLASLARKFRARRIAAGALTLASPEVKFVLDSESLNPTDVQSYALFEANALVEEFMLLANVTVGKKILRHYPTLSILRRHPAPNRGMFDSLISKAQCRGFQIHIDTSKHLADSLDAAVIESDPYFNKLLRILSTRCMSPAQYFCSGEYRPTDWHHYGLAAPVYTHFTSPIRRYADVCVHRLLAAAIGVAPLPVHLSSKSYLHDLAANMNRRHRAAQLAGRASVQLHTLLFFSGDSGAKEEDAYVLDVDTGEGNEPTFTVIVPRYGIEGRVRPGVAADDPRLVREPDFHRVKYMDAEGSSNSVASVQVFDKVRVRIWVRVVQESRKELVLDLLEPKFSVGNECNATGNSKKRERDVLASTSHANSKKRRQD